MKLALYGYGGHAREVAVQIDQPIDFFVDDELVNEFTRPISEFDPKEYQIMVAIGDSKKREQIIKTLPEETRYFTFIHPSVKILDKNIKIGRGTFIGVNCVLTTNIEIGNFSILNRGNHIGHDCKIGEFFSCMPGSIISGNVDIGDRCYLGTNSSVIEKIKITNDVIIGAGGVVVDNINESGTYVGVPAKKIIK